jgi:hypothetical protein
VRGLKCWWYPWTISCSFRFSRHCTTCYFVQGWRDGYRAGPLFVSVFQFFFFMKAISSNRTDRAQQMAASTTKAPKCAVRSQKLSSNKGKGKENIPKPVQTNSCMWDARNYDDATPWNWTSLTDPSSTGIPPLFTKDGRWVAPRMKLSITKGTKSLVTFFPLSAPQSRYTPA